MITKKDYELQEALAFARATKLPKAINPETSKRIWVDAIIEVKKNDGSTSYAYAYNRIGKKPKIVKVYGSAAMIIEHLSIHPINYLAKEHIPANLKTREQTIEYVATLYRSTVEKISQYTDEQLEILLYTSAIERQIVQIKEERDLNK